jgi:plastocyanin
MKIYYLPIIYLLLIVITSCNHDDPFPPNTNNNTNLSTQSTTQVVMQNTTFNPTEITITKGTTITWINKDAIPHTVTSDQGLFNSGNIPANGTYEFKFDAAGTYNYHCIYHAPYMVGKVIVQ